MSSGVVDKAEVISLRATAHPVRLRILSLLTGAAMSAAEVARELEITHANASYHLRLLHQVGLLVDAGEESIRGGRAKRYRYNLDRPAASSGDPATSAVYYQALAGELVRRAVSRANVGRLGTSTDAELWVSRAAWSDAVERVASASTDLHRAAKAPRSPGSVHVSVTMALFEMGDRTDGADT